VKAKVKTTRTPIDYMARTRAWYLALGYARNLTLLVK
jgi:hypothetical protein